MGSTNEELIAEFGDALDEWAGAVREACRAAEFSTSSSPAG